MDETTSKVYIQTDTQGCILRCEGGYTTPADLAGWTLADEGTGDRYNLCQSNYFDGGLYTEDGLPRYRWDGSQAVLRTDAELEEDRLPLYAAQARVRRDKLLEATDWTQTLDAPISPESRESYRAYRQSLRDIPEQPGFPTAIQWPVEPVAVKAAPDPVDTAFDALVGGESNA